MILIYCEGVFDLSSLHINPFFIDNGIEVTAEINTNDLFLTDTINCYGASNAQASVLNSNPQFDYSWHLENSSDIIDQGISTNVLPADNIQCQHHILGSVRQHHHQYQL